MAMDDHVTTMPEASDRGAPEAAAASRRRQRQRLETLRAFALGAGFPILLVRSGIAPSRSQVRGLFRARIRSR